MGSSFLPSASGGTNSASTSQIPSTAQHNSTSRFWFPARRAMSTHPHTAVLLRLLPVPTALCCCCLWCRRHKCHRHFAGQIGPQIGIAAAAAMPLPCHCHCRLLGLNVPSLGGGCPIGSGICLIQKEAMPCSPLKEALASTYKLGTHWITSKGPPISSRTFSPEKILWGQGVEPRAHTPLPLPEALIGPLLKMLHPKTPINRTYLQGFPAALASSKFNKLAR